MFDATLGALHVGLWVNLIRGVYHLPILLLLLGLLPHLAHVLLLAHLVSRVDLAVGNLSLGRIDVGSMRSLRNLSINSLSRKHLDVLVMRRLDLNINRLHGRTSSYHLS